MYTARTDPRQPITPERFQRAEQVVTAWLESVGFLVGSACYHNVLPTSMARLLQSRYSPTALIVRHRADRIAVHQTAHVEFLVEVKSAAPGHYANMLVEMPPLAVHILEAQQFGCECLYTYSDPAADIEAGFWCSNPPPVRRVMIPARWTEPQRSWFQSLAQAAFPAAQVVFGGTTRGSGDPFAIIADDVLCNLPDWRTIVEQRVRDAQTETPA